MKRLADWGEIVTLSQQLSAIARKENWEEVTNLATKRHQMITSFFLEPVTEDIAPEIASGIELIQDIDKEIVQLAHKSKQKISEHLSEIAKGKHMSKVYSNNTQV
ncbi:MAG: flagellar protein FliT [Chromatiales bacterium]|nr:flagellar protein FliT [Chromatiales bacterium]